MNEEAGESASRKGGNGTVGTNTGMEDQPPCEDNDE
jgi:hypothetical protein